MAKDDHAYDMGRWLAEEEEGQAQEGGGGYAWEEEYKRSWDVLQEDEHGTLNTAIQVLQRQQQQILRKQRYGESQRE